jgi:hypothetical protein
MAKMKRAAWNAFFNSMVRSARLLIKNRDQLRQVVREALGKNTKIFGCDSRNTSRLADNHKIAGVMAVRGL